jgi:micrococcal nuclease
VPVVLALVLVLWLAGLLPQDALANNAPAANAPSSLIDRPWLDLPAPSELRPGFVRIHRVVDGDTLVLASDERLRLIGVNTDEVPKGRIDPQGSGWQAALWLEALLKPDAQVRLEFDEERIDKYGRTLAYAYLPDGRMVNELLLREGWAKTLRIAPNTRHAKRFAEIEREAKAAGTGRWGR